MAAADSSAAEDQAQPGNPARLPPLFLKVKHVQVEQVTPEQIAALAERVLVALGGVEKTAGAEAAARACEILTRLSTHYLFTCIGPQATKNMLIRVYADLQSEISALNGGSTTLS